jgi:hypothetical protein
MLRFGSRSFSCQKKEKNAFLVRYGRRQIGFITLISFEWCDIFYKRQTVCCGTIRCAEFRISSHSVEKFTLKNVKKM